MCLNESERLEASELQFGKVRLEWVPFIDLSGYGKDDFVDKVELAGLINRSERAINRMVARGALPPPEQNHGKNTWKISALETWFIDADKRNCSALIASLKELQLFLDKQLNY